MRNLLAFTLLYLLDTLALMTTYPRMGAWWQVTAIALYGFAVWYGSLYWNGVIAEWAIKRFNHAQRISTNS